MPIVQLEDGSTAQFPDDWDAARIQSAIDEMSAPDSFSVKEMVANIPGSAAGVAGDLYQAVTNPIDTAKAVGQSLVGGIQNVQDYMPGPTKYLAPFALANAATAMDQDYRPQASAVADMYADRYGGVDEALNTLEQDPVGALADVTGVIGAGAPGFAARVNPFTRAVGAVGKGAGKKIMESAAKFSTVAEPDDVAMMVNTMLDKGINPSKGGVRKLKDLIEKQGAYVDDLIAQADQKGTVPIGEVLRKLNELKRERGASLVGGSDDLAAVDQFITGVIDNARRLGKRDLSASDLQKLKRDLYDQIAWNASRQVDEVPILEDTRKTTARGAKEIIEQMIPEVKGANQQFGDYLELLPNLERSARRIGNRDPFGMTDMFSVGTAMGGTSLGSPALGATLGLGIGVTSNPRISPFIARAAYQAGRGIASPAGQGALSFPYLGAQAYYAGERGALEEDED